MFTLHPKTKKLLELFSEASYGDEFSYAAILDQTGCDLMGGDRQRIYTVVKNLERNHQRTLLNIRGQGYRIARPGEFAGSMRVRTRRAKGQLVRAGKTGQAAPLALLNDTESRELTDERAFNERVIQAFKYQTAWNTQQDQRIHDIEQELKALRGERPPIEGGTGRNEK